FDQRRVYHGFLGASMGDEQRLELAHERLAADGGLRFRKFLRELANLLVVLVHQFAGIGVAERSQRHAHFFKYAHLSLLALRIGLAHLRKLALACQSDGCRYWCQRSAYTIGVAKQPRRQPPPRK